MSFTHISTCLPNGNRNVNDHVKILSMCWHGVVSESGVISIPVSLKKGTLTIEVRDTVSADHVREQRREIVKRANAVLGADAVLRVRWIENQRLSKQPALRPIPEPGEETLKIASVIEDPQLRKQFVRILSLHQAKRAEP